jgi:hypothetical protein
MDDFDAGTDARRVCSTVIGRTGGGHIPRRGEPGYAKKETARLGNQTFRATPPGHCVSLDYVM